MARYINWKKRGEPNVDAWSSSCAVVFFTQRSYQEGERFVELRMQTFKNIDGHLKNQSIEKWHVLAKIFNDRIETWPVHVDPCSELYLTPTHKIINCIRYRPPKPFASVLPQNPEDAISLIEWVFDPKFFHSCSQGLGLQSIFIESLSLLSLSPSITTLELNFEGSMTQTKQTLRISEITLAKLADDYNFAFIQWSRAGSRKRNVTQASRHQNFQESRGIGTPASRHLTEALGLKSLNPADLDKVLLPVLTETPEQALSLWSYIKSSVLNNMISQFQAMLIDRDDTNSWKRFLERHISFIHEALRDPSCGILDRTPNQVAEPTRKSNKSLIIATEPPLVLIVKSPDTPLVTRVQSGAVTISWCVSAQIQSAVNEALELARQFEGSETNFMSRRCVVIAGIVPKGEAPLAEFLGYSSTVRHIQIVDYTALLEGLRRLASKIIG